MLAQVCSLAMCVSELVPVVRRSIQTSNKSKTFAHTQASVLACLLAQVTPVLREGGRSGSLPKKIPHRCPIGAKAL